MLLIPGTILTNAAIVTDNGVESIQALISLGDPIGSTLLFALNVRRLIISFCVTKDIHY